jgi:hypothetical protein
MAGEPERQVIAIIKLAKWVIAVRFGPLQIPRNIQPPFNLSTPRGKWRGSVFR